MTTMHATPRPSSRGELPGDAGGHGPRPATVVLGLLLVAGGLGWLLDATGLVSLPVTGLLAVALIAVGAVLMLDANRHTHGGLIALGVVLTLVLAISATAGRLDLDPAAGVGDRSARPTTVAELATPYRLGTGTLTLDLRGLALPAGETVARARVGAGRIVVLVPAEVPLQLHGRVGVGAIQAFGRVESGMGVDATMTDPSAAVAYAHAQTRLSLDLRIGTGQIEVQR